MADLILSLHNRDRQPYIYFGLCHHCYADDTRLYGSCHQIYRTALKDKSMRCIDDIAKWVASNRLKVN